MPLYVHIFTSDTDPVALMNEIKNQIIHSSITFGCRTEGNHFHKNVLEDLFAMTAFDVLIRPDSNFSIVADKLNDYLCVISPWECEWNGNMLNITQQKLRLNIAHPKYEWILKESHQFNTMFHQIEKVSIAPTPEKPEIK